MPGRLRSSLLATAPMPAPPVRNFSFTDWQVNNPTAPPPGDKIDSNFDLTNAAVAAQLTWASVSINSDGTIRDGIIDANNLVPGLFDDVAQDIINTVQPLVDEAQSYAQSAQTSSLNAQAAETDAETQAAAAANSAAAADADAEAASNSEDAASLSAASALASKGAAETAANHASGSENQSYLYTNLAGAWAEHMPDTIPPDVLAVMAISGDHWSSRWWANQAAKAFGNAAWYYAGAGPVPPLMTVDGQPLPIGAIWFDTSVPPGVIRIWNGVTWVAGVSGSLPPGSVSTVEILDGTIQTVDLSDGCVTLAKLAPNSVDSSKIVDGSIALADLAPNSVDSSKIVDGSIATIDLANLSVTQGKLALLSVGTPQLIDGAVTSAKIADGTIDPVDLSAATLNLINTANPFDQVLNKASAVQFASTKFGGITAAFPMLKPNGPELQVRLADDSAFGSMQLSKLGIGMVPVNKLDITQNQNAASAISLLNNDPGVGASANLQLSNGTNNGIIRYTGTGISIVAGSGDRPNSLLLSCGGRGGMVFSTPDNTVAGGLITSAFSWFMASVEKMRIWPSGGVSFGDFFTYAIDPSLPGRINLHGQTGGVVSTYAPGVPSGSASMFISAPNASGIVTNDNSTATNQAARFYNPNGNIGAIQTSGAATAYLTTSDERLKTFGGPQRDFRRIIRSIQLRDGEFHCDPGKRRLMFSAQQVFAVGFDDAIAPPSQRTAEQIEMDISLNVPRSDVWMADMGAFSPLALWGVQDLYGLLAAVEARLAAGGL